MTLTSHDTENQPPTAAAAASSMPAPCLFDAPLKPVIAALPPGASSPQRTRPAQAATTTPTAILGHSSPTKSTQQADDSVIPMHAADPLAVCSHPVARWSPPAAPADLHIDPRDLRRLGSPGSGSHSGTLGFGAYGSVFRASWNGMLVAVKELDSLPSRLPASSSESARLTEDDECLQDSYAEWLAELSVWRDLKHPGIVQLYGGYTQPKLAFVMQLLGGGALSDHLYASPPTHIPWSTLLHLMRQTASSLLYMHSRHVVHRDLKSFNVLLDEEGNAFLSDFGLSVAMTAEDEEAFDKRQQPLVTAQHDSAAHEPVNVTPRKGPRATGALLSPPQLGLAGAHPIPLPPHSPARAARVMRSPHKQPSISIDPLDHGEEPYPRFGVGLPGATGGPLGTYGFMSPELFTHARSYSPASDTYAFGCMLLEIITRAVPWGAMPPVDIARNVVSGRRPPLPRGTPQRFANLITACWTQQARERPSMDHVLRELTAMEDEALRAEDAEAHEQQQQQPRHERVISSSSPEQQRICSPSPAAALVARMAAFGSPAGSDVLQLSSDDLASLTRSERQYYNQQLRKHHGEARALRHSESDFPASPNFADQSAAAAGDDDEAAHEEQDETFWAAVRMQEARSSLLLPSPSPADGIALNPVAQGASHQRHDSVASCASSSSSSAAAAEPNSNLVRCKARSRKSRKLLAQIARLMEEAEMDGGSSSSDDSEPEPCPAHATATQDVQSLIVPSAADEPAASSISIPRNVTPVLPFALVASALLPLPASGATTAATAAVPGDQQPPAPIAAWTDSTAPNVALCVSTPMVAVVRAENLLLQHCAAAPGAPSSAASLPAAPTLAASQHLLTPSSSSMDHFRAAPNSSSSSSLAHSTPSSAASHSLSASNQSNATPTPTPAHLLSPAKFARSPSTTWTPERSSCGTEPAAEASQASNGQEMEQVRPPLTLPQRSLLPSLALPARPALAASLSSPTTVHKAPPLTCADEERKEHLPQCTPSSKAKRRAQVAPAPAEQLDAVVPRARAEPEPAANHACCTIM